MPEISHKMSRFIDFLRALLSDLSGDRFKFSIFTYLINIYNKYFAEIFNEFTFVSAYFLEGTS